MFVLACGLVLSVGVVVVIKRGSFVFTTAMPMEVRYVYMAIWGHCSLQCCC